ncbi:MAG TPA: hypothetical protein PLD10_13330, partial [Rhodopila sp.]|nr:hypothetical protein [Rhodopila sp.]
MTLLLAGCSTIEAMNPVNWWHRQEGGKIAEQRPAPPGADQPYPNLSTVPGKPVAPDQEALKKLTDSLIADRTNAQHAAQAAPIADPSSPTASPSLFGVGTTPPPPPPGAIPSSGTSAGHTSPSTSPSSADTSSGNSAQPPVASASMPAVTAPPPPAAPPSPAPRKPVQSTPLSAPPQQQAAAPAASPPVQAPPQAVATAEPAPVQPAAPSQPTLPAAPPPRPAAAGSPPPPPPTPSPMPATAGASADIVFLQGASSLSQPATDEVKAFAAKRGNAVIGVTGYGDSVSSDPAAQSA